MTTIKITGEEVKSSEYGKRHTILDGKIKYSFYENRKDGEKTKAFEQWESMGLKVGNTVEAEVKEEPDSFTDQTTKKLIKYTKRTIIYFNEDKPTETKSGSTLVSQQYRDYGETNLERIEAKLDTVIRGIAKILEVVDRPSAKPMENNPKAEEPELPDF